MSAATITSERSLPDALRDLGRFLNAAAADWERREAELKRNEVFLAQAQRVTKTGSIWWKPSTNEIAWSEGNYRLMEYPIEMAPTVEMALARCHPEDLSRVEEKIGAAMCEGTPMDFEHRLLMPSGVVKHVRVVIQNVAPVGGDPEFLGAATDITEWKEAEERLRQTTPTSLSCVRSWLACLA